MSILIKGMKMPKSCWQCTFHDDVDECILLNQSCMVVWGESKRLEDCPLIEVPTPHGRLIDADALKETFCGNCFADEKPMECFDDPCMDIRIILDAPTIIPEEEGET